MIIRQSWCPPKYSIRDANQEEILHMEGPTCMITGPCCPNDIDFNVSTCISVKDHFSSTD